ncbi:lactate 2-monooxygenase [Pseudochryseolinea flava]|uniref:Lactate 2-monooxygenase n=1 Tax=Pseudochryseolinea flava TaxID=2059302 RepID=A0A364XVV6_9BACT|nr:lactate 2-monooxygenase [Pseudochryseolinea flava]RAV98284.1 lactate 2-monooxygenase [Pseudochryseolinea flava]
MDQTAANWQKEIYLNGFAGHRSKVPVDFSRLEAEAKRIMSRNAYAYIAGGAGVESTMTGNRKAFDRYKIVPRMLCDVGARDTSISIFGHTLPSPFLMSPVGVLEMVHSQADLAVANAAKRLSLPYIFSNQASFPMEECAALMDTSPRWFQLYWSKSNDLVESFVQRAQRCGCTAIVVTLDTTLLGWRARDLDIGYLPFLEGKGIAQYTSDPVFQKMMDEPDLGPEVQRRVTPSSLVGLVKMVNRYPGNGFFKKLRSGRPLKAVRKFVSTYSNPRTTWNDLKLLREYTSLPIVLKGILHPDDARKAIDHGIDGIIVSNHGGRQVDGAIATFDALPAIAKVVNKKIPVLLDSGIRGGADAFKAIAMGATAVCVGRPYVYGLTIAGAQGVYEVLRNIMADFELTMGLAGCRNIREIVENTLARP